MKKKIIPSIIIIVLILGLGFGAYFFYPRQKKSEEHTIMEKIIKIDETLEELEQIEPMEELDLSESGLQTAQLTDIDLNLDFPDANLDFEIEAPTGELDAPQKKLDAPATPKVGFTFDYSGMASNTAKQQTNDSSFTEPTEAPAYSEPTSEPTSQPPAAPPGPDEATCAQFATVPLCSYVPANVRDLCEQCKGE